MGLNNRQSLCVSAVNHPSVNLIWAGCVAGMIVGYAFSKIINYKVGIVVFVFCIACPYLLAKAQPHLWRVLIRNRFFPDYHAND